MLREPRACNSGLGPVSRKSRKLFGPEKPFVKLRPAYSVKLVFSYVVKGIKIKITVKFRASRRLRCGDTKRIMSPEIRSKSFGSFEKQAPGVQFLVSIPLTTTANIRENVTSKFTSLSRFFRPIGVVPYMQGVLNLDWYE